MIVKYLTVPRRNEETGRWLMTTKELASASGKSRQAVEKLLKRESVGFETEILSSGGTRKWHDVESIKAQTYAVAVATELERMQPDATWSDATTQNLVASDARPELKAVLHSAKTDFALFRLEREMSDSHNRSQKIAALRAGLLSLSEEGYGKPQAIALIDDAGILSRSRAYDLLKDDALPKPLLDELEGALTVGETPYFLRMPRGTLEERQVFQVMLSNEPSVKIQTIHRVLEWHFGDAYAKSYATTRRIVKALRTHPVVGRAFLNGDERKEFMRTWSGRVIAHHPNQLWEIDMTRCDVMVVDPLNKDPIFRPRIQFVMDICTRCIMGLSIARSENQTQADRAFLSAVVPKPNSRYESFRNLFGTPKRLYLDNGSTYKSAHFDRLLSELGVEKVHSGARVSHTRGHIERGFGVLHQSLETSLTGYVGKDAVERDSVGNERLRKKTLAALERGDLYERDPARGERLYTLDEYQELVLAYIDAVYHELNVPGKDIKRREAFDVWDKLDTQPVYRPRDLFMIGAFQKDCRVYGDGTIQFKNTRYRIPGGALNVFQGDSVRAYWTEESLEQGRLLICYVSPKGIPEEVGMAEPAPEDALTAQAKDAREQNKRVNKGLLDVTKQLSKELGDPSMRSATALMRNLGHKLDTESNRAKALNARPGQALPPATPDSQKEDTKTALDFNAYPDTEDMSEGELEMYEFVEEGQKRGLSDEAILEAYFRSKGIKDKWTQ